MHSFIIHLTNWSVIAWMKTVTWNTQMSFQRFYSGVRNQGPSKTRLLGTYFRSLMSGAVVHHRLTTRNKDLVCTRAQKPRHWLCGTDRFATQNVDFLDSGYELSALRNRSVCHTERKLLEFVSQEPIG